MIRADSAGQVPAALAAMEAARAPGRHGWPAGFAYELGYALEPRLGRPDAARGRCCGSGSLTRPCGGAGRQAGRAYAGPLQPEWDAAAYGRALRAR